YSITHLIGGRKWQLRVCYRKLRAMCLDVMAGFPDDFKVADHGILSHLVFQECHFAHVLSVTIDALDSFQDVRQIIREALFVTAHTGNASDSTAARNFSGRAFGVNTSTGTPSS